LREIETFRHRVASIERANISVITGKFKFTGTTPVLSTFRGQRAGIVIFTGGTFKDSLKRTIAVGTYRLCAGVSIIVIFAKCDLPCAFAINAQAFSCARIIIITSSLCHRLMGTCPAHFIFETSIYGAVIAVIAVDIHPSHIAPRFSIPVASFDLHMRANGIAGLKTKSLRRGTRGIGFLFVIGTATITFTTLHPCENTRKGIESKFFSAFLRGFLCSTRAKSQALLSEGAIRLDIENTLLLNSTGTACLA